MLFAVTMVHNEMPLLPLTLANLLNQGVDRILIADHNSSDGTLAWLRSAERSESRITVIAHGTLAMNQSAVFTSLARVATALGATWILPFDADEFWLATDRSRRLADVLAAADERGLEAIAVRPMNFVAPRDCAEFQPSDLSRFSHRFAHREPGSLDDLSHFQRGTRAFASCAYPDKWILKANPGVVIGAGAHTARGLALSISDALTDDVRCLHIPLRSRRFLDAKQAHGAVLRASGYPPEHGWQNQILIGLSDDQLDRVWAANSVGEGGAAGEVVADPSLALLWAQLSNHPLVTQVAAAGNAAGKRGNTVASAWLGVTESLVTEVETIGAGRVAALDLAAQERRARSDAQDQLQEERAQTLLLDRELEQTRTQLAGVLRSRSMRYTAWPRTLARRVRRSKPAGPDALGIDPKAGLTRP